VKRLISAIVLALVTFGTATGQTLTEFQDPKPGQGILYIYRPATSVNLLVGLKVYVDGKKYPKLKNGGYQVYELAAGRHQVATRGSLPFYPGKNDVEVTLQEGERLFLRIDSGTNVVYTGRPTHMKLVPVEEGTAKKEIFETSLSM
jgi:hypothetical protein